MDDKLIERIKAPSKWGGTWGGTCTDGSYVREMESRILADAKIIKAADEFVNTCEMVIDELGADGLLYNDALAAYIAAVSERDT